MSHKMSKINSPYLALVSVNCSVSKKISFKNFKFQLDIGTCNSIFERTTILMYLYVMKIIFRYMYECKGIDGFINDVA